jgi:hypothetical protein
MRKEVLSEGYHVFKAIESEDKGYELALTAMEAKVKEAEKDFTMVFLSGASVKDSPDTRGVSVASQAAVLTKKKKGKNEAI